MTLSFSVVWLQALPLVTVMVGSRTPDQNVSIVTTTEAVDEPRRVDFVLPKDNKPLSPGQPSWANYIKGVVQHYRGNFTLTLAVY